AELPYATVALVTDHDCWRETEAAVSVDTIRATLRANTRLAEQSVQGLASHLPDPALSPARAALQGAVLRRRDTMEHEALARLGWRLPPRSSRSAPVELHLLAAVRSFSSERPMSHARPTPVLVVRSIAFDLLGLPS